VLPFAQDDRKEEKPQLVDEAFFQQGTDQSGASCNDFALAAGIASLTVSPMNNLCGSNRAIAKTTWATMTTAPEPECARLRWDEDFRAHGRPSERWICFARRMT
jgi:hypothetical protein